MDARIFRIFFLFIKSAEMMCVGVGCEIFMIFLNQSAQHQIKLSKRPSENALSVACFDLETAAVNTEFVFPINANNMWICWNRL